MHLRFRATCSFLIYAFLSLLDYCVCQNNKQLPMSTPNTVPASNNPNQPAKSFTSNFELQTKIRVIIQEVLAATIRKLSHFGDKIDKFQQYFITFRERFQTAERERVHQQQEMAQIQSSQKTIRRDLNFNEIRYNEDKERINILGKQHKDEYQELQKMIKGLVRQNENVTSELSKTKSKFIEYSNTISTLKEEVSWKITKYLEETAESHTQMKVFAEKIKNQYFNINLMVEKQKEKYDQILLKYEEDTAFKDNTVSQINEANKENAARIQAIKSLNTKIDDIQFSILSKLKALQVRFQGKIEQMDKNNSKLSNTLKKVESFSSLIDNIKEEVQENSKSFSKKMEDIGKKATDYTNDEVAKLIKENNKLEKSHQKKVATIYDKMDKLQDFFLQKMDFMKMEIESQMSSKTVKILEQKSKTEQNLNQSTMEEINSKMNKHQLETRQQISKLESTLKESVSDIKQSVEHFKDEVESKIEDSKAYASKGPLMEAYGQRNHFSNSDLGPIKQQIKGAINRILLLELGRQSFQQSITQLKKKVQYDIHAQEQKLNSKVEKVMFLVTKMRGDSIIRNQFNDKQIKQVKRNNIQIRDRMQTTWKLLPGMGECINLIMSLIYDAEYQHSRIIVDSLPQLSKEAQKFNTCYEGVLYEFRERKKPGCIFYRHSEMKKTDIVKATFNGYIQIWEEIYEVDLKNKQHLLPKGFYKRLVEKHFKFPNKSSNEKQMMPLDRMVSTSVQLKSTGVIPDANNRQLDSNSRHFSQSNNQSMNSSFHIRKKRTTIVARQKEESSSEQMNQIRE